MASYSSWPGVASFSHEVLVTMLKFVLVFSCFIVFAMSFPIVLAADLLLLTARAVCAGSSMHNGTYKSQNRITH